MAHVIMTRYTCTENILVFPECPNAGEPFGYDSLEVRCKRGENYCSENNQKGLCPFDRKNPKRSCNARLSMRRVRDDNGLCVGEIMLYHKMQGER